MSIEVRRSTRRTWGRRGCAIAALALVVGCGGGGDAPGGGEGASGAPANAAPPGSDAQLTAAPATVADLFPPGPERELLMNNCANCHAVACAAMGQRSASRWADIEAGHRENVPNLPEADRQRIFAYLRANFNESRPEPTIPPEFLDRGCTPF